MYTHTLIRYSPLFWYLFHIIHHSLTLSHSYLLLLILSMEEILHHLRCINPCKYWDKLPTTWWTPDFSHQQYHPFQDETPFASYQAANFRRCISSVRRVLGRISTGGLKTKVPRTSFSSSSKAALESLELGVDGSYVPWSKVAFFWGWETSHL